MKTSTLLALAGIGGAAFLLSRRGSTGASGADTNALNVRDGDFVPKNAATMPDFAEVVGDIMEGEDDWMQWCAAPGYDRAAGNMATTPLNLVDEYRRKLWEPASRISIDTLTVGDLQRAAFFMGGSWKQGIPVGCPTSIPDRVFGDVSGRLEQDASGLDIGAAIGTAIVGIFAPGWKDAAKASDSTFGFGRGAQELREVKIDIESLPASFRVDLAALDTDATPRPDPAGVPQGANVLYASDGEPIACMANLFSSSWQSWDAGNSGFGIEDFIAARAGIDTRRGSYQFRNPETGELETLSSRDVALYQVTDVKLGDNRQIESSKVYLRRGWNNPWLSREMGCVLSHRERIYVRARMLRTIDLIHALLMPSSSLLAVRDLGIAETFRIFDDGSTGERFDGRYVTFSYESRRYGNVRGSIFPAKPGDAMLPDFAANYVPFGGSGDLPPPESIPRTPEQNRIDTLSATPVVAMPAQTAVPIPEPMPAPTSTSAGAPPSSSSTAPVTPTSLRTSRLARLY